VQTAGQGRVYTNVVVRTELASDVQKMTSYSVAFLSPDPVTMYLSSFEMSLHSTDDDSFDYNRHTES